MDVLLLLLACFLISTNLWGVFAMFFIYKFIDFLAYKKLRLVNSIKKLLLIDLLIILASYIFCICFAIGGTILIDETFKVISNFLLFGTILSNILSLIIMHRIELKRFGCETENKKILKKHVYLDAILLLCYDLICLCFEQWSHVASRDDLTSFMFGSVSHALKMKWRVINGIGYLAPFIVFIVIRIIVEVFFVKKQRKNKLTTENQ
ncbi:MAG: hypothetical protein E7646_02410 [Ruminococcaceae bacterium]|nr:hypothetical protein [Oscillospiraceae bacterium]